MFFIRDVFEITSISKVISDIPYITFYESYIFCKAPSPFSKGTLKKIIRAQEEHKTNTDLYK